MRNITKITQPKWPVFTLCLWSTVWIMVLMNATFAADFQVQDSQLKQCLENIARDKQWSQADDFIEIKCHSKDIQSLLGLEQFKNVEVLSVYNNRLGEIGIDLGKLQNLKTLNLARNNLKQVVIADAANLENLYLFANSIVTLQLTNLPNLHELKVNNNGIKTFHYSNTPKLDKIYIFDNQLETINIYDLPALQYMDCRENPMPDELYDEMDRMAGITFLHDGNAEDW